MLILSLLLSLTVQAKPLAMVYAGPGSCENSAQSTGCTEAAANVAKQAGFDVELVGPTEIPKTTPVLWIQPGGRAKVQQKTMSAGLKTWINKFVAAGGGYVGFCAGGFMATERFGWANEDGSRFEVQGLGLLKGTSEYYDSFDPQLSDTMHAVIINTSWAGAQRSLYWELGPYFVPATYQGADVIAYYPGETKALALRTTFGKGRVFVSATHPEAPQDWRDWYKVNDPDGLDYDLAMSMMTWAAAAQAPTFVFVDETPVDPTPATATPVEQAPAQ